MDRRTDEQKLYIGLNQDRAVRKLRRDKNRSNQVPACLSLKLQICGAILFIRATSDAREHD